LAFCSFSHISFIPQENTTFHGIRDSIQTAGWLRALWVCIIVLASVAALIGCGLIGWSISLAFL